jgi:prevent-host-death family protein
MSIPAALFKAECLKLMDVVARTGRPVVITKHGRPVAQLAPVPAEQRSLFGYMKGSFRIAGDVVKPADERWSATSGDEDRLYRRPRMAKGTRSRHMAKRGGRARPRKR